MKLKNITLLVVVLVAIDQIVKIVIKTTMRIDEAIVVIPNWFQLRFVENNGAAYGMQIASWGDFDWGKLGLTLFRIGLCVALAFYMRHLARNNAPKGVLIGMALIMAGAVGNIVDSMFYGQIFSVSTPQAVAHLGDGYAPLMMGKVVDMFYFPLFQWNSCPRVLSFLVDSNNYFFGAIFNVADAYISVAVVYLLIFQYKFFK